MPDPRSCSSPARAPRPTDHEGPRGEPSFTSLLEAYYGAGLGDWSVVWERRAQPGDTILVHAGLYRPEHERIPPDRGTLAHLMPVHFGPFTLDSARRQLTRGSTPIHLTPKAFDLLALLVGEAPRVVPKSELHERLWPGTFVADATLVGLVKELRRALEDHDRRVPIIRTAHRVGYGFCLDVADSESARTRTRSHWVLAGSRRVPLRAGENVIGRNPESAVWVDSASVSRRHARILIDTTGAVLDDLGSKNGTMVNGVRATGSVPLQSGDRIHIGSVLLIYRSSGSDMSTETHIDGPRARS